MAFLTPCGYHHLERGFLRIHKVGVGWLFSIALLPGLLTGFFLLHDLYQSEKQQLEQGALQTARALTMALDRDLAGISGKLQILATSPALQAKNFGDFYQQAQQVLALEAVAEAIVLVDESGQQIVNTLRPWGSVLPRTGHPELLAHTFASGRQSISDSYIGGVAKRHFVALEIPVFQGGKVQYALDMGISSERLSRLLEQQKLPSGWIATALDSKGVVIARSLNANNAVGKTATPDLLARLAASPEGTLASSTLEGTPSFLAYTRSDVSRWTVAVVMPREALYANLYRHMAWISVGIASCIFAGVLLTWWFSRHVRHALFQLGSVADCAARGDLDIMAPLSGPHEIARLAKKFNAMQLARKKTDLQLRLSANVFNHANQGIFIADKDAHIVDVNQAFTRLTGYPKSEVLGQNPRFLNSGRHDSAFFQTLWQTLVDTGHWQGEIWDQRKDGSQFVASTNINAVTDPVTGVSHYIALFTDITEDKLRQDEIERMAHYDPLTQLPNRRLLLDRAHKALSLAHRHQSQVAVCYMDLDEFKPVNDTYGHRAGDLLLQEIARRLGEALREHDTLSRLGGDEFVLLLTDLQSASECQTILDRVLQLVSIPFYVDKEHQVRVSASIGVALYPTDGETPEVLMRRADQAMYQAKHQGRNQIQWFRVDAKGTPPV